MNGCFLSVISGFYKNIKVVKRTVSYFVTEVKERTTGNSLKSNGLQKWMESHDKPAV